MSKSDTRRNIKAANTNILACERAFGRYFSPNREPVHRLPTFMRPRLSVGPVGRLVRITPAALL